MRCLLYSWNVEDYCNNSIYQKKWALDFINSKIRFKGNERVLDIGCGDGSISAIISSKLSNGSLLCIDSSKEMISYAHNRFLRKEYSNLFFQIGDARHLNFYNEFDIVVSFACFHWISDQVSLLKTVKRSMKPQGKLFIQIGGMGNESDLINTANKVIKTIKWVKYFNNFSYKWGFFSDNEYIAFLKKAGLKINNVELVPKKMVYKNKEGLKSWIRTTWQPYLERVPDNLQSQFINDVASNYVAKFPNDIDDSIIIKMSRLEVSAEKS